jgi:hypothetical protein
MLLRRFVSMPACSKIVYRTFPSQSQTLFPPDMPNGLEVELKREAIFDFLSLFC